MITNWDQLPLVMHPEHMAQLLGVTVATIWRRCQKQCMRPTPVSWQKPYEWYRETVRAQLEAGVTRVPIGRPKRRRPLERARQAFAALESGTAVNQAR